LPSRGCRGGERVERRARLEHVEDQKAGVGLGGDVREQARDTNVTRCHELVLPAGEPSDHLFVASL
jgi:hypothetical protein